MGHVYKKEKREKQKKQHEEERKRKLANKDASMSSVQDDTPSPLRSLDLLRGQAALKAIQSMTGTEYGNYVSYVKGLPAAILQNGLGQALATLLAGAKLGKTNLSERSADEDAKKRLFSQTQEWICRDDVSAPYRNAVDLMQAIISGDEDAYIRAQAETLAYLSWVKKFAVAFLDKEGTSDAPTV